MLLHFGDLSKLLHIGKQTVQISSFSVPRRFNSTINDEKCPQGQTKKVEENSRKRSKSKGVSSEEVSDMKGGAKSRSSSKSSMRNGILVPRVPPTDYIPSQDVQAEGLYAGYRPLFLGNSPVRAGKTYNALDNFFSSFTNLKVIDESKNSREVSIHDIIEDLRRDNTDESMQSTNGASRKPIIPWDASISGMVYNDQSFKHVPKNVVSKLKPFKIVRVERKSEGRKNVKGTDMIKMKVHGSKVNDESEIVNLSHSYHARKASHVWHGDRSNTEKEAAMTARKCYEREMNDYTYRHKFIKSDQRIFKTDTEKINRLLAKEFYKQTNLSINADFTKNSLPLYIYVDKSISARRLFRRYLKKRIVEHIEPVLATLLSSYDTKEQVERFESKIALKINNVVRELSEYLPSVYFTGNSVDCVLHSSPIPGFKRIHWLKPYKRHCVFWGKNIEMDYFFHLNGEYNVTRGGVKYMKYPVNLHWKTFHSAFSEWDYFA